jgi:protease-4
MTSLITAPFRFLKWLFGRLFSLMDAGRRIAVNLFFLGLIAGAVVLAVLSGRSDVKPKSVLVLAPEGPMVEEMPKGLRDTAFAQLQGDGPKGVLLRDWVEGLEKAARDERIDRVLLVLDQFEGAGLPTLREAAAAIETFKASGKQVVAWGANFDQRQYYLAAHASKVYLHPMGVVMIEGIGRQRNYYKDALDRLGIKANLVRVGQFKSAGEPFVANAPSKEALEAEAHVYDAIWKLYMSGIEKARKLPEGAITSGIDALPGSLVAARGNAAKLALDGKLVDEIRTFEDLRQSLIREVGKDEKAKTFRQANLRTFLADVRKPVVGERVAIVVAQGEIGDGTAPAGRIGGRSTAKMIREAADDKAVKAIVLRVNSPGGSAFGSELIRDQLELARRAGKPVVVSMGDVAASGGYWISMSSDRVIADPATITGSIGVFGMLPTAEGLMAKLSVNTGGHATTWLADAYDVRKPLDPRVTELVQSVIGNIYAEFTGKTAAARRMDVAKVDAVAQGRIWTGQQALGHGLVDQVGGLQDAVASARQLAKAGDKELPFRYVGREPSKFEALVDLFASRIGARVGDAMQEQAPLAGLLMADPASREVAADLHWLGDLLAGRKAFDAVVHCLCRPAI